MRRSFLTHRSQLSTLQNLTFGDLKPGETFQFLPGHAQRSDMIRVKIRPTGSYTDDSAMALCHEGGTIVPGVSYCAFDTNTTDPVKRVAVTMSSAPKTDDLPPYEG